MSRMMKSKYTTSFTAMAFVCAAIGLSGCSVYEKVTESLGEKKSVNYQNNKSVKALEIPPDLTAPEFDREFDLPAAGTISAASMQSGGGFTNSGLISPTTVARPQAQSQQQSVNRRVGDLSSIRSLNGAAVLQINDSYARSLILTEIILQRLGFAVTARNTTGDGYQVQYNGNDVPLQQQSNSGLSGLFNRTKRLVGLGNKRKALARGGSYQVKLINKQGAPILRFLNSAGQPLVDAANTKVITLLNNEFNK